MIKIFFILFLSLWYYICYISFIEPHGEADNSLKERLGTILWHSSDYGGEEHVYCYYPKKGNVIIKRVQKIDECGDFLGIAIFYEGSLVTEKDKILTSSTI